MKGKAWIVPIYGTVPPHLIGNAWARKSGSAIVYDKMPSPDFLLVECIEGQAFIYRYNKYKVFCGDTWHQTLEDAQNQIAVEYPNMTGEWIDAPDNAEDAIKFGVRLTNIPSAP